jgi:S-adenosylmethionine-diacylglycerol 3-amino-3-carboxypropyl transferase
MKALLPEWVESAARLPVAFAQVREDPVVDAAVLAGFGRALRIIMIASGGCTLAYLAARFPLANVNVVDPNPAQLALARLKLYLLNHFDGPKRLAFLGHEPMDPHERAKVLGKVWQALQLQPDAIGPVEDWARDGPDQTGRYERVFVQLRTLLETHVAEIHDLLSLRDPAEQARRASPHTALGKALDDAFDQVMDLPILIRLFGEGATRNRALPFARHFAHRTRHALSTLPALENPFLWQVLTGRYPPGTSAPWLSEPTQMPGDGPGARECRITWIQSFMTDALAQSPQAYDFVHLSNILDWLSPSEAQTTLDLACAALRPGGCVLIRQLNSTLDIPNFGKGLAWDKAWADKLHRGDRSYFYRGLHLGRKP